MKPIITVIMPSLNVIKYISECMDSVRTQTLENIEILCIDAGSTDGTIEYLRDCSGQDDRIRVIISDKKSYGYQVNLGIKEAKGCYIAIVETDDYIDRGMFHRLYRLADKYDLDYVKADFDMICEETSGTVVRRKCLFKQDSILYNRVLIPKDYNHILINDNNIWNGIYRKEFILANKILLQETLGAAYQDIGFTLQVSQKAERAMYVPESYYRYRLNRAESSSVSMNILQYVYQEFVWLFENKKVEKTEAVYNRLACAFISELNKLLIKSDYNTEVSHILEPYVWMKKELLNIVEKGQLNRSFFPKEIWHNILFALDDLKGYAKYQHFRSKLNDIQREELSPFLNEAELIVFGSGVYGKMIKCLFDEMGRKLTAFADNDSKLWGQEIEGVTVLQPRECYEKHRNAAYVVASKKYADEIYEQLCINGISKIFIWR